MPKTKIEWTNETWNPVTGCTKVSQGCKNCYAETRAKRLKAMGVKQYQDVVNERGWTGKMVLIPEKLEAPLHWREPRMVFVNSMSDLFHPDVPFEFIERVFDAMNKASWHTYQILTKRPEIAVKFFKQDAHRLERRLSKFPLPNVWIGVSCENQETADERIPLLLQIPAAVRFVSLEPLLGPIESLPILFPHDRLDWVIVGGESGADARPCYIHSIRNIVKQCKDIGVPVFVKQLGAKCYEVHEDGLVDGEYEYPLSDSKGGDPSEWPEDLRVREFPKQLSR